MKFTITFAALVVASASFAQTFYDSQLSSSLGTVTSTETQSVTKVTRNLTGFSIGVGQAHSIAWNFKYTSPAAFTSVTLKVNGSVDAGGGVQAIGTEEIFDISGPTAIQVGSGLLTGTYSSQTASPFSFSVNIPINPATSAGAVSKDLLFINTGTANFSIDSIEQEFTPVPEPATMAALGVGIAALLRRRRK